MPEFFLELFSEEIPARMQADAAHELQVVTAQLFDSLSAKDIETFYGPRRIAISATLEAEKQGGVFEARGPRANAPDAALNGFLGKHSASREEIVIEDGYYWLRRATPPISAADLLVKSLPDALSELSWPKSMRWGQSGNFTWVRPLRRIVCLFGGEILPFKFGPVTSGDETEGHRFLAPGPFSVSGSRDWKDGLWDRKVYADDEARKESVLEGLDRVAKYLGLTVVNDFSLIDEVNGLVEWPVPLIGRIDEDFMSLPPEVRELSMKVNQRYFALRDAQGRPAPYFAFVSNIEAVDGGKAIIAGNERVLRARLSDARHFWDLDLKTPLNELLPKLDKITFHAKIGSQGERVQWIANTAREIAGFLGADPSDVAQAEWAGRLSKADLVTGMVGEFPELQGVMGGYYAEKNPRGWSGDIVGPAIKTHYQPRGPSDDVPTGIVPISVALADKFVTLVRFFENGERPTGSGDPYALRRAALGVIRIILDNNLPLPVKIFSDNRDDVFDFIIERLRVKLRGEGKRFDVLDAVLAAGSDDRLVRIMRRVDALSQMLETDDGKNLHSAYKRAANILRIEDPQGLIPDGRLFHVSYDVRAENHLATAIDNVRGSIIDSRLMQEERYAEAMTHLASLRPAIDSFFENVTVNDKAPEIRERRLRLLKEFCWLVDQIADFSKIEG